MSPPRGGDSWKWSETENQSKPFASANFHSLRISASGPPMWPMWIPNFILSLLPGAGWPLSRLWATADHTAPGAKVTIGPRHCALRFLARGPQHRFDVGHPDEL